MTYYTFEIVVEKEAEDDGYMAYSPTLPGCYSNGKSIEDAKRNIREAVQQHLQSLLARNVSVTIPIHTGCDVGRGLAVRILKDAGFSIEDYSKK